MEITTTKITRPPRMVIYGAHGIGKSTFGASCPSPVFIQTEDGLDALEVEAFPLATCYEQVIDALDHLITQKHQYKTLVIDSLDWLEKLIFTKICAIKNASDISEIPFGRGHSAAERIWYELLAKTNELNQKHKMIICFLAHAQIKRFEDPERESYDRYQLDLNTKGAALICEYSDIVAFASYKIATNSKDGGFGQTITKARSTGERTLYLDERPAFIAKNRYKLPAALEFSWPALYNELKKPRKVRTGNLAETADTKIAQALTTDKTDIKEN